MRMAPSKHSAKLKITMLSLLAVSLLTGCGIRGTLKTPPPVFGGDAKVDPERVPDEDLDKEQDKDDDLFIDAPLDDI